MHEVVTADLEPEIFVYREGLITLKDKLGKVILKDFSPSLKTSRRVITISDYDQIEYVESTDAEQTVYEILYKDSTGKSPDINMHIRARDCFYTMHVDVFNSTEKSLDIDEITILKTNSIGGEENIEKFAFGGTRFQSWNNHTLPLPIKSRWQDSPYPVKNPIPESPHTHIFCPMVHIINRNDIASNTIIGFSTSKRSHSFIRFIENGEGSFLLKASCLREGVNLQPGEEISSEMLELITGCDYFDTQLEYSRKVSEYVTPKRNIHPKIYFCTWYPWREGVCPENLYRIIPELARLQEEHPYLNPITLTLDDGILQRPGDGFSPNSKFEDGKLENIIKIAHEYGLRIELWTALTSVANGSETHVNHPDWLLTDKDGNPIVAKENVWPAEECDNGDVYALDLTNSDVWGRFIIPGIRTLRDYNIDGVKIDFLSGASLPAPSMKRGVTSMQAYTTGLERIRSLLSEEVELSVCGAPIVASLEVCDNIRIATDTNTEYSCELKDGTLGGLQAVLPSVISNLWVKNIRNADIDCLMLRKAGSNLTTVEREQMVNLYSLIPDARMGIGDDLATLEPEQRNVLDAVLKTKSCTDTVVKSILLSTDYPAVMVTSTHTPSGHRTIGVFNFSDDTISVDLEEFENFAGTEFKKLVLGPHSSQVLHQPAISF